MTSDEKDRAAARELYRVIRDFHQWVNKNLKPKSPDRAQFVNSSLMALEMAVRKQPEQAHAALHAINATWHMLLDDAWTGYGVRHGRKRRSYLREVSASDVVKAFNAIRKANPNISKTSAVPKVAKKLECSQRTVWSKLKEANN